MCHDKVSLQAHDEMCNLHLFTHYKPAADNTAVESTDLLTARAKVLIACGKGLMKVGDALSKHSMESPDPRTAIKTAEQSLAREKVIGKVMKDRFYRIEQDFAASI